MERFIHWFENLFARNSVETRPVNPIPKPSVSSKPKNVPLNSDLQPWIGLAKSQLGVSEWARGSNPQIEEYHKATTLPKDLINEDTPWCSSFVSWCLEKAGYRSTSDAWARSYLDYGIKLDKPKPGCIVVFERGSSSGHVAFFVKENLTTITCLGGNQGNQVCYSDYAKYRVLGYRWPVK